MQRCTGNSTIAFLETQKLLRKEILADIAWAVVSFNVGIVQFTVRDKAR